MCFLHFRVVVDWITKFYTFKLLKKGVNDEIYKNFHLGNCYM